MNTEMAIDIIDTSELFAELVQEAYDDDYVKESVDDLLKRLERQKKEGTISDEIYKKQKKALEERRANEVSNLKIAQDKKEKEKKKQEAEDNRLHNKIKNKIMGGHKMRAAYESEHECYRYNMANVTKPFHDNLIAYETVVNYDPEEKLFTVTYEGEEVIRRNVTDTQSLFEVYCKDGVAPSLTMESTLEKVTTESTAEEFSVGTMMPQVPLTGDTLEKPTGTESVDDSEDDATVITDEENPESVEDIVDEEAPISVDVLEYVMNPEIPYSVMVEEGVKDAVANLGHNIKISARTKKVLMDRALLKAKIKRASKKKDNGTQVAVLKRDLVRKEKELRGLKVGIDKETAREIDALARKMEKDINEKQKLEGDKVAPVKEYTMDDVIANTKVDNSINDIIATFESTITDKDNLALSNVISNRVAVECLAYTADREYTPVLTETLDDVDKSANLVYGDVFKEACENVATLICEYTKEMTALQMKEHTICESTDDKESIHAQFDTIRVRKEKEYTERYQAVMADATATYVEEKAHLDDRMKPIVDKLNDKGYKVKYASPGYNDLKLGKDKDDDGKFEGKMDSDARVMFQEDYDLPEAPKYWKFRKVDGKDYLDVVPTEYKSKDGGQKDARGEWREAYLGTLETWVNDLPKKGEEKKEKEEEKEEVTEESVDAMYESIMFDLVMDLDLD